MTAETLELNEIQSPAAELLQLPVYEFGAQTAESLIDPRYSKESQIVLKRYIESGLNIAKQAQSRVERIAKALVHEVVTMTPEKAAKIAKSTITTYIKNINPANFIKEDWYWRGGVGLGVGIGTILTVTGARVNPWIRTSVCLGLSAGFETLANIDYQNATKKLDKLDLTVEEKTQKLAELDKIKAKAKKINKGVSAGFAYLGFINFAEAAEVSTHFIEEGAKAIDWSKAQIGEVLAPQTAYAAELPQTDVYPLDISTRLDAETAAGAAHASMYTLDGYKLTDIEFPKVDVDGNDLPSTKGLVEALYRNGITQQAQMGSFDPKNYEQLVLVNEEIAADPEYTKKLAAAANYYMKVLNKDYAAAFTINDDTGVYGETFRRTYDSGKVIKYHNIDSEGWKKFFAGDWQKYYDPEAEKIVTEAPKQAHWDAHIFSEDSIYKDLKPADLEAAHFAQTDIDPGQLHHTGGLAEAIVSQQVEGHPGVDFSGESAEKAAALADAQANVLHDLNVQSVKTQFNYDNHGAVVDSDLGEPTDFFYSANKDNHAIALNILQDYAESAKSLAPLVDEQSLKDGVVSSDFWRSYTLNDLVSNPDSLFSSLQVENAFNIRGLAEIILAKEYGIDVETLRQKVAEDPNLAAKLEKAIAYFKINNSQDLINGDNFKYRSPVTGQLYHFRLPREDALKKLISLI